MELVLIYCCNLSFIVKSRHYYSYIYFYLANNYNFQKQQKYYCKNIVDNIISSNNLFCSKNFPSRILIWENSLELIKENFWFGTSPGDAQSHIDKNYLKNKKFTPKEGQEYNSHNQYLQTFVESGFIGFLLLMSIFGGGLIIAYKRKQMLFSMFLFIVLLNFFFDSMLNGFAGMVFIFYFFNYFIFIYKKKSPK